MKLLFRDGLHFQEKGPTEDPHIGLCVSSGCLPVALQGPHLLGKGSPPSVKGSKQGAECWKQESEVLGNLIRKCETKKSP